MKFLLLPPQTDVTRSWAEQLRRELPELEVGAPEDGEETARLIGGADGAFGALTPQLLARAPRLRWLQAPFAAPPAGYYHQDLIEHPVVVTNMRGLFNDHVGTHAMALVLGLVRGLHHYIPAQHNRRWSPLPPKESVLHLPEATALVVGAGGIGAEIASLNAAPPI